MRRLILPTALIAAFVLFVLIMLTFVGDGTRDVAPSGEIAVVVYGGEDTDRWNAMEQGIQQACSELGIAKPVLVYDGYDVGQQKYLIRRELAAGADGILVAVSGEKDMQDYLEEVAETVPLVLVESGTGDSLTTVSADNYLMGVELAEAVAKEEGRVAVLVEGLERRSVALRYNGFMAHMEELGVEVITLDRSQDESGRDLRAFLAAALTNQQEQIANLVVLDNDLMEIALEALPYARKQPNLFGVGTSSTLVHAVDQGDITGLIYQNEYAVGYIGIMTLAAEMGLTDWDEQPEIQCRLITRDNMFDRENEQLIFPLVG